MCFTPSFCQLAALRRLRTCAFEFAFSKYSYIAIIDLYPLVQCQIALSSWKSRGWKCSLWFVLPRKVFVSQLPHDWSIISLGCVCVLPSALQFVRPHTQRRIHIEIVATCECPWLHFGKVVFLDFTDTQSADRLNYMPLNLLHKQNDLVCLLYTKIFLWGEKI